MQMIWEKKEEVKRRLDHVALFHETTCIPQFFLFIDFDSLLGRRRRRQSLTVYEWMDISSEWRRGETITW